MDRFVTKTQQFHRLFIERPQPQMPMSQVMAWLEWRHNERHAVSNRWRLECLLNRLFRRTSKKGSKLCATGLCGGIHRWPVDSPHKGPVTRKMFPFDDVIMLRCMCQPSKAGSPRARKKLGSLLVNHKNSNFSINKVPSRSDSQNTKITIQMRHHCVWVRSN